MRKRVIRTNQLGDQANGCNFVSNSILSVASNDTIYYFEKKTIYGNRYYNIKYGKKTISQQNHVLVLNLNHKWNQRSTSK